MATNMIDYDLPHIITAGAIILYAPRTLPRGGTDIRPVTSLVPGMLWPGRDLLPPDIVPETLAGTTAERALVNTAALRAAAAGITHAITLTSPAADGVIASIRTLGPNRSHAERAAVLGLTRASVSHALRNLRATGTVTTAYRTARLTRDPAGGQ